MSENKTKIKIDHCIRYDNVPSGGSVVIGTDAMMYAQVETASPHAVTIGTAKMYQPKGRLSHLKPHPARDSVLLELPSLEAFQKLQGLVNDTAGMVMRDIEKHEQKQPQEDDDGD